MATALEIYARIQTSPELSWRLLLCATLLLGWMMLFTSGEATESCMWHLLYGYSALLILTAQMSNTVRSFFIGEGVGLIDTIKYYATGAALPAEASSHSATVDERSQVGFFTLMTSAFITWIFAKSINNAAVYGGRWGVLGGVGYAGWYLSFPAAAIVGYYLRTRHGFRSLPEAIERNYGPLAQLGFAIALFFRLWNEVWSNTAVVADFFSTYKSREWWTAAIFSAAVPAVYVVMGGMRASLVSDVGQAGLGILFLIVILVLVSKEMGDVSVWEWKPPPTEAHPDGWYSGGGWVVLASCIQGTISYPFHDPVLTDRSFLSRPRTMLAALCCGGAIAGTFIILFSAIGIYGDFRENAVNNGSPAVVANALGGAMECFILLVMMTSSLSTLDSTFTSCAKLVSLEVFGWFKLPGDVRAPGHRGPLTPRDASVTTLHILIGRVAIVVLAIVGSLYLDAEGDAVRATEVSGTMVMGLGPPVWLSLIWRYNSSPGANDGFRKAPLAFMLSFLPGLVFGILYSAGTWPASSGGPVEGIRSALESTAMGEGSFRIFLGW